MQACVNEFQIFQKTGNLVSFPIRQSGNVTQLSYQELQPLVEMVSPSWYSVPLKVQVTTLLVGAVVGGGAVVVGGAVVWGGTVVEVSVRPLEQ